MLVGPYTYATAITPSDTVNIPIPFELIPAFTAGIYVGVTGDVVVVLQDASTVTFVGALAGTILPVAAVRVNQTNTTATNLIALFSV